jgi:RimJ/RimL family protein N-acetyltransferase
MKTLPKITYQPLSSGKAFTAEFDGQQGRVNDASFRAARAENGLKLDIQADDLTLAVALDYLFSHDKELAFVEVEKAPAFFAGNRIGRKEFMQWPAAWHRRGDYALSPESWVTTNERAHPARPRLVAGTQYRRYVPEIGKTISFRVADVARDAEIFHQWHNQERVSALWDLNKPFEELREYLTKGLADPHQIPMILEFDGEAAGYFEIYWTPEDRLGPYYQYDPFDRGFHFLIGPDKFLGTANTYAVLVSVSHFLFLDEARTRRVMGEPRADNQRVIRYVEMVAGWKKLKEFDFPNKRAALLCCDRGEFFSKGAL